jgi:hypothetical protein
MGKIQLPIIEGSRAKYDTDGVRGLSAAEISKMDYAFQIADYFIEVVSPLSPGDKITTYEKATSVLLEMDIKTQANVLVTGTLSDNKGVGPKYFKRIAAISPKRAAVLLKRIKSKYKKRPKTYFYYAKRLIKSLNKDLRANVLSRLHELDAKFSLQLDGNNIVISSKVSPSEALSDLLSRSDYVFIGETHGVEDERVFVERMEKAYESGVRTLALEFPVGQQVALDHFLNTGDLSHFTYPLNKALDLIFLQTVKLIQAASDAGIDVVCVDASDGYQSNGFEHYRETTLANNLARLSKNGKTLVLIGGAHAQKGGSSFQHVAAKLIKEGHAVSSIVLESQSSIDYYRNSGGEHSRKAYHAYSSYFGNSGRVKQSFAAPTDLLGSLNFLNAEGDLVSYAEAYDYVFFLSNEDSQVPVMPNNAGQNKLLRKFIKKLRQLRDALKD